MTSQWRWFSFRLVDSGPLAFALGLCVGAATYLAIEFEPSWLFVAALFCGSGAFFLVARRFSRGLLLPVLATVLLGCSFGVLLGKSHAAAAPSSFAGTGERPVMVEGWINEITSGASGPRLTLTVHSIAGEPSDALPLRVRVTHRLSLNVHPGQFVRCWSVLRPPPPKNLRDDFDFQRQAYFRGLSAVGYVQGRCRGGSLGRPNGAFRQLSLKIASFRRNLALAVDSRIDNRASGFAAALISGDRSLMPQDQQRALRRSGLAHLLAISGLHLGIVGGLVYFLVRRAWVFIEPLALRVSAQKPAALIALVATGSYLILSGASVSTQRAFIMAAVVFGAVLADRSALSLRTFAIAMIAVLCLQPSEVLSPGFQMSFAASGALIATYEAWRKRQRGRPKRHNRISVALGSIVLTSFVASAATTPFAIYHFGRIAPMGLIANVLAMPIVSFVTAPLAALAIIFAPFGMDWPLELFGQSLDVVLHVAERFSSDATSSIFQAKQMPGVSLALFSIAIVCAVIGNGASRWITTFSMMSAGAVFWSVSPQLIYHSSGDGVAYSLVERGYAGTSIVDGGGLAPLSFIGVGSSPCDDPTCLVIIQDLEIRISKPDQACDRQHSYQYVKNENLIDIEILCGASETAANGLSIYRHRNGDISIEETNNCGNRHWNAC